MDVATQVTIILAVFFLVVLVIAIAILAMFLVQTPYHASLDTRTTVETTLKLTGIGSLDVQPNPFQATAGATGILMVVTEATFALAAATVEHLRGLTALPIQVWYGEREIMNAVNVAAPLRRLQSVPGVSIHDMFATAPGLAGVLAGAPLHHLTAVALYLTPLRHVVCMSPHVTWVCDPLTVLHTPEYTSTGAVIFPDFHNSFNAGVVETMAWLGIASPIHNYNCRTNEVETGKWDTWCMDTSVVLMDRGRHWEALHAMLVLAMHHARMPLRSRGGKEMVWMALEAIHDTHYTRAGWYAGTLDHPGCPGASGIPSIVQHLHGRVVYCTHVSMMPLEHMDAVQVHTICSHAHRIKDIWDLPRFIRAYGGSQWVRAKGAYYPCAIHARPGGEVEPLAEEAVEQLRRYARMLQSTPPFAGASHPVNK